MLLSSPSPRQPMPRGRCPSLMRWTRFGFERHSWRDLTGRKLTQSSWPKKIGAMKPDEDDEAAAKRVFTITQRIDASTLLYQGRLNRNSECTKMSIRARRKEPKEAQEKSQKVKALSVTPSPLVGYKLESVYRCPTYISISNPPYLKERLHGRMWPTQLVFSRFYPFYKPTTSIFSVNCHMYDQ